MKEIRNSEGFSLVDGESRKVEGYAIVFNKESRNLGGFTEIISPNALDGVLEKSTVLALMNHDESRGVLARNVRGVGSLQLEIDDIGLRYSFDAPKTALGDELIEGLKRGDINTSSFAFSVRKEDVTWSEYRDDGTRLRTINKFAEIYDVSPVYREAYEDTSVALRSFEEFNKEDEERKQETKEEEEVKEDASKMEEKDEHQNEDKTEDVKDDNSSHDEEDNEESDKEDSEDNKVNKVQKESNKRMEKFSLIKSIRSIVNNQPIDEANQAVLDCGKEEMKRSGLSYTGQIQLPIEERATVQATVTGAGEEIVATEKLNILEPLRNKLVLTELGANYLTGLVGNISIPKYSGTNAGWAGEVAAASDGAGSFSSVEYSPKRITAYVDISKQFINQDSVGAEQMLRNDIVAAVAQVLEGTILGDAAGSTTKPKGIFNGASAPTLTFAGLVDMEKNLEENKINGDFKFVVSPAIKATLKQTAVGGTKSDIRMLMDGGEANGYPVLSTGNCKGIALAKWDELIVAQFGAIDVTVDPYSQATNGCIRLVVNAYFDAKFRRDEAVIAKKPTA